MILTKNVPGKINFIIKDLDNIILFKVLIQKVDILYLNFQIVVLLYLIHHIQNDLMKINVIQLFYFR
jgi:hypothetical protein